ncbi:ribonuclease H-like domain-containing protein [Tanacetum coccineum]
MEAGTTSKTLIEKFPILNSGDYNLWLMRIEQYFLMADYSLWEVILNGNKVLKRIVGETEQEYERTTVEEKQDRRNEIKARGTMFMALPNKDQLKFHSYKDAKLLWKPLRRGSSSTSKNPQNVAFVSSNNNSGTNEADNTAYGVTAAHTQSNPTSGDNLSNAVICAFLASQHNSPQLAHEDLEQIDPDDLEEMDLQWEMAMLTIRARRFIKRTSRKLDVNGQRVGFDRFKVECYNCHKKGHFARECRAPRNQENRERENSRRTMTVETPTVKCLGCLGWIGASSIAASSVVECFGNSSEIDAVEPKTVRKNSFRPPVIEDWNSDDDSEVEFIPNVKDKTVRPSTEKIKFVKSARETVEKVETPKQNKHYPRGNQRNWNNLMSQRLGSDFKMINKACFVCGSFEHLHYVCDKKVIRPVWNNSSRVNHKNFANKMTHPHPNRRFVPQAVLTRSGKINTASASVNTAIRPVNTAGSKTTVNHPRPISNAYKKGYSQVTRPFNKYSANKNSIFNKKVNTVRVKDTTTRDRAVGNPQQKEYKEKGVIDSGCSRHMTGNKCYLTEYEDYDGGFVSFRDGKGRISCRISIKATWMKSQILLRVSKKDNIYSVDTKDVVPTKGVRLASLNLGAEFVAGNQSNDIAGTRDNIVVGQAEKKKDSEQDEEDVEEKPTEMDESGASESARRGGRMNTQQE